MAVLHEEILKSVHGTEEKAIQPTWLLTVASVGSVSVKAVENEGGDDPNSPHTSLSPARCTSCSPMPCTSPPTNLHVAGSLVPHSPSHSPPTPHLQTVALEAQDQVPLLQAPALGQKVAQGAHWVLAAQVHLDQARVMSLVQDPQRNPKHLQTVALAVWSDPAPHLLM